MRPFRKDFASLLRIGSFRKPPIPCCSAVLRAVCQLTQAAGFLWIPPCPVHQRRWQGLGRLDAQFTQHLGLADHIAAVLAQFLWALV
jgi:hypothetical protein